MLITSGEHYYMGSQWNLSPLNPSNNINNMDVAIVSVANGSWWEEAHRVLCQPVFLSVQQALVGKVKGSVVLRPGRAV